MKFLGVGIYAAALLAYTQGLPGNRWHHKDRYEDVEEIHYQVVTEKPPPPINETTTEEVPTSGVSLVSDDVECPAVGDSLLGEEVRRCT